MPNSFAHDQNRKVAVFCKDPEMQEIAKQTDAHLTGGTDLIKQIQVRYKTQICFATYKSRRVIANVMMVVSFINL